MYLKYLMHAKRRRIKGDVVISNMHSCFDFITSFSINQVFSSRTRLLPLFSCRFGSVALLFQSFTPQICHVSPVSLGSNWEAHQLPVSNACFSLSNAFFSIRET